MGSPILGSCRLLVYLLWTVLLIPAQYLAVALRHPLRKRIPPFYHRVCARILGFRVEAVGQPADAPTLFISNHSSYLDITILGSLAPVSFVAKSEVAGWPFFGLLAKLQETVFIERTKRAGTARQADDIKGRLEAGDSLILFPEGTSSDGNRVLPFKTALFAVANTRVDGRPLTVQPVSVTATHLDGIPLGHGMRTLYSWFGDMDLVPHLWQVFTLGTMTVVVEFHPPVTVDSFAGSRKALADHCQARVAAGVSRAVTGRRPEAVAPPSPSPVPVPAPAS